MINGQDLIAAFAQYEPPKPRPIRDFIRHVLISLALVLLLCAAVAILFAAVVASAFVFDQHPEMAQLGVVFLVLWFVFFLIVRYV